MIRMAIAATLALMLSGCGVKTELDRPDPRMMKADETDPSKPPHPLGESGGTDDMPLPTGP